MCQVQVPSVGAQVSAEGDMQQEGVWLRLLHQLSPASAPPPPGVPRSEAPHSPSSGDIFKQVQEKPSEAMMHGSALGDLFS